MAFSRTLRQRAEGIFLSVSVSAMVEGHGAAVGHGSSSRSKSLRAQIRCSHRLCSCSEATPLMKRLSRHLEGTFTGIEVLVTACENPRT